MLVLARKIGQVIKLGPDISVTVLEIRGDTVRLGIDAPRSLPVHRLEIYQEIERANQEAARSNFTPLDLVQFKKKQKN